MLFTFYWTTTVLSILSYTSAYVLQENRTLASYICDDELLKTIIQKMTLLETSNENLRLKLDTQNIIINREFMQLKEARTGSAASSGACKQTQPECSNENEESAGGYSYDNLIDIRGAFDEPKNVTCKTSTSTSSSSTITTKRIPNSCAEALRQSGRPNGLHKIQIPDSQRRPFYVYCLEDPKRDGGAWTIIQRRIDGSIDFYRPWSDYQRGFGNWEGEFFLGLEKIHALTQSTLHELWIQLEDFENNRRWAKYSTFALGDSSESYALNVLGSYSGDAGDSLTPHAGMKFTTKDVDNDVHETMNCAVNYLGAWWYKSCHESNLNGQYLRGAYPKDKYGKGIDWYKWRDHTYSMKYVHMAIRPLSLGN